LPHLVDILSSIMRGDVRATFCGLCGLCALLVLPVATCEDLDDGADVPAAAARRTANRYTFALEHDISGTGTQFTRRNDVSYEGSVDMVSTKRGSRPTLRVSKFAFSPKEVDAIEVRCDAGW
jgi:hypothetical protein